MSEINDPEFGTVTVRRSSRSRSIRIRVAPDGRLQVSTPLYTPLFSVKRILKTSRAKLRTMLEENSPTDIYDDGRQIGKSHHLQVRYADVATPSTARHGQQIIVTLPHGMNPLEPSVQRLVRDDVIKALRREAKSYLPKRLRYLADQYGYDYTKVRFSHASGRWGSCSTSGTISLNIALMKLPFELIDYVLIHELCHTQEMNHSREFWSLVAAANPDFKTHRKALKSEMPTI